MGASGASRSAVSWISDLPMPITSMNCLGYCGVLIGQKRLPMPPAMMTTWFCIVFIWLL